MQSFKIFDSKMPKNMIARLTSWLEENVGIDDIAFGLKSNNLDAESFTRAAGMAPRIRLTLEPKEVA